MGKEHNSDYVRKVYEYPTIYKQGFTSEEMLNFLYTVNKPINMSKFSEALNGITVQVIDSKVIRYHTDIAKALLCGLENRKLKTSEWD